MRQDADKVPLVRIESDQFETKKLDRDYKLGDFQNKHSLDSGCSNVFVQISKVDLRNKKTRDFILMVKV